MAFIKVQKLVRDENGEVKSGSAAIVGTTYVPGEKSHAKHYVIEKLGKVLYWDKNLKTGIFQSPLRGLVEYSAQTDEFKDVELDDPRLPAHITDVEPEMHTTFGDGWFLLDFMKKQGLDEVLRGVFSKKSQCQRLWAHIVHSVARDGSRISCEDWITRSFLSYLTDAVTLHSLKGDTVYFEDMGKDNTRMAFFKGFIALMRTKKPGFGKCCYVDSTPLPNDISNNPFNALSSHGMNCCGIMTRLVLILDSESGLPVWYEIIPGNVLDLHTLKTVIEDVSVSLGITVEDMVLDAGYISRELLQECPLVFDAQGKPVSPARTFTGRMPARKGFPHRALYQKVKNIMHNAKYSFVRDGRTYFGVRKEVEIGGIREYAYVYVDFSNALRSFTNWRIDHEEEYERLLDKEKNWKAVEYGFFILVSNIGLEPSEMLERYFGRTAVEQVFKTSKEYLDLLPLRKWSDTTVRGKILSDIIATIVLLMLRAEVAPVQKSLSEYFGKLSSVMCVRSTPDRVTVARANKQATTFLKQAGIVIPTRLNLNNYRQMMQPLGCSL